MKALRILLIFLMILLVPLSALAEIKYSEEMEYPEGTLFRGVYGYTEEIEFLQYQLFYAGYLGGRHF